MGGAMAVAIWVVEWLLGCSVGEGRRAGGRAWLGNIIKRKHLYTTLDIEKAFHEPSGQVNCRYQLLPRPCLGSVPASQPLSLPAPSISTPPTFWAPHPVMKWMRILFAIDFQYNVYYFYYIRRQLGEKGLCRRAELARTLGNSGVAGKLWAFHNVNSRINTLFVSAK